VIHRRLTLSSGITKSFSCCCSWPWVRRCQAHRCRPSCHSASSTTRVWRGYPARRPHCSYPLDPATTPCCTRLTCSRKASAKCACCLCVYVMARSRAFDLADAAVRTRSPSRRGGLLLLPHSTAIIIYSNPSCSCFSPEVVVFFAEGLKDLIFHSPCLLHRAPWRTKKL